MSAWDNRMSSEGGAECYRQLCRVHGGWRPPVDVCRSARCLGRVQLASHLGLHQRRLRTSGAVEADHCARSEPQRRRVGRFHRTRALALERRASLANEKATLWVRRPSASLSEVTAILPHYAIRFGEWRGACHVTALDIE